MNSVRRTKEGGGGIVRPPDMSGMFFFVENNFDNFVDCMLFIMHSTAFQQHPKQVKRYSINDRHTIILYACYVIWMRSHVCGVIVFEF